MDDDELPYEVLRTIDTLLSDRPGKADDDFSDATRRLSAWRDTLAERWRQTRALSDRGNLERVTAALRVVLGGQFPLDGVPWAHRKRARQDLAELAARR